MIVLFIPSVERDGKTAIDQNLWVDEALGMFGDVFGGATAYPQARGVWRDDKRGGTLVFDQPVIIHCYTTPANIRAPSKVGRLAAFCRRMGRIANQGEVGLVVASEYFAFRDFKAIGR